MTQVFSDAELQTLVAVMRPAALAYLQGGQTEEGNPWYGCDVRFVYLEDIQRDIGFARETYLSRDGYMGLKLMSLCDALRIIAYGKELEVHHIRALGNRDAEHTLFTFFENRNPHNNPLSRSGMREILNEPLQNKFKAASTDMAEVERIKKAFLAPAA